METRALTANGELMAQARSLLNGKWGPVIGTFVVYLIVLLGLQSIPKAGWLIGLVIWLARGEDFAKSGVFSRLTLMIDFSLLCLGTAG